MNDCLYAELLHIDHGGPNDSTTKLIGIVMDRLNILSI